MSSFVRLTMMGVLAAAGVGGAVGIAIHTDPNRSGNWREVLPPPDDGQPVNSQLAAYDNEANPLERNPLDPRRLNTRRFNTRHLDPTRVVPNPLNPDGPNPNGPNPNDRRDSRRLSSPDPPIRSHGRPAPVVDPPPAPIHLAPVVAGDGSAEIASPPEPVAAPYRPAVSQSVVDRLQRQAELAEQQNVFLQDFMQKTLPTMVEAINQNNPAAQAQSAPLPPPQAPDEAQDPFTDEPLRPGPSTIAQSELHRGEGDGEIELTAVDRPIREVLDLISQQGNLNILASKGVSGNVSASLRNVDLNSALDAILKSTGYVARREGNFIFVGTPEDFKEIQNSSEQVNTRVYRPNYVTAAELQTLVTPMLSENVGKATISVGRIAATSPSSVGIQSDAAAAGGNDFAGGDVLLVIDYESVLRKVDQVVAEVDCSPQQVSIEAMIISVRLDDTNELGVNFELLRNRDTIRLVSGVAQNTLATAEFMEGGLKVGFLDANLYSFINALETIGETNVIASPRLMCLNKQRAEIHIGEELGYISTSITETSSTQEVNFLEVGTQLRMRPFISRDGMIRMEIHPELSTGTVRVEQGFTLPDKEVTQVTSNVMCRNGSTIVIGGLIREDLSNSATQIPILGNLPLVGPAFRQKTEGVDRRELIVLITPRIVFEPHLDEEGSSLRDQFRSRQEVVADKMSPHSKVYYGRRYLRHARAAWNAGDLKRALRYVNLSIHCDAMNRDAVNLRDEIVASGAGDFSIDSRLRVGLPPWQRAGRDYSRDGYPWGDPLPPGHEIMPPDDAAIGHLNDIPRVITLETLPRHSGDQP